MCSTIRYSIVVLSLFAFFSAIGQVPQGLLDIDLKEIRKLKEEHSSTRISPNLLTISDDFDAGKSMAVRRNTRIRNNKILIEAYATSTETAEKLEADLITMGLTGISRYKHIINGMLPMNQIMKVSSIKELKYMTEVIPPSLNVGSVNSQADQAMFSLDIRNQFGISGIGKKIGVLSDSYNTLNGAAAGVASGDLPNDVDVLLELNGPGSDEGRAMIELIHDIAPKSDLAFHTAFGGIATFANGIIALQDAGCDIIVDDIIYFCEGMYHDGGVLIEAINEVTDNGALYFSSAGNNLDYSYESEYRESNISLNNGNFPFVFENGNIAQQFSLPPGRSVNFAVQWDEPNNIWTSNPQPYSNPVESDIDVLIYNSSFQIVGSSLIDNPRFQFPCEFAGVSNDSTFTQNYFLVMARYGPVAPKPNLIKYVMFGDAFAVDFVDLPALVNKGTCYGHANTKNAVAVGAARYDRTPAFGVTPPVLEVFSSHGGVPLLFDNLGNPFPEPVILQKPDLVAPQGTNNTFFGFDYEGDGFPNFFGTSASAPHAAALTALLCSKSSSNRALKPAFSAESVLAILKETAIDMDEPGFDLTSGAGLVDGLAACNKIFDDFGIPTLGQWGLICLMLSLLITGIVAVYQKKVELVSNE